MLHRAQAKDDATKTQGPSLAKHILENPENLLGLAQDDASYGARFGTPEGVP